METELVDEAPSPPPPNKARAAWIVAGVMTAVALIAAMVAVSAVMREGDDNKTRPPLGARRATFTRPVTGTVASVDGTSFTVREKFPNGETETTKVVTNKNTTFRQSVEGAIADLAVGDTITVTGTTADSVLTALRITETANQATVVRGEMPGGRFGVARPRVLQAGPGNMRIGEITKVEGDTITLASLDGVSVPVKTTAGTKVRVNETMTLRNLEKGDKVRVFGARKDGALVASEVTKGDFDDALVSSLATKPYVVMPTVAVVIFSGWFAVQTRGGDGGAGDEPSEQVVEVTEGTMRRTVSAQGTVAAADADNLNFAAAGTVTAVHVKAGDKVASGAVLATMDSPVLRQAVAEAEARLAAAQATLAEDTASGASAARLIADRSSVTSARNGLEEAKRALAGAALTAPYAAKVSSVGVTVGDKLGANGQPSSSTTGSDSGSGLSGNNLGDTDNNNGSDTAAIALVTLDSFKVDLGFDATDIGEIASDQAAQVTLSTATSGSPFGPGGPRVFQFGGPGALANAKAVEAPTSDTTTPAASDEASAEGVVASVSQVADASSGVASYPVVVTFHDSTGSFNVGATVQVEITVEEIENAIQVPLAAVIPSDNGGSAVTVRTASGDELRDVETGLTDDGMIQITRGLDGTEQVVISFGNFAGSVAR